MHFRSTLGIPPPHPTPCTTATEAKKKSLCTPPPQNQPSPLPASGFGARKPREGEGEGLGHKCEPPWMPAQFNARLWQGKENKVKFGNQMTVIARLLFSPAAFVSAAPKYLFLKCCKWQAASSANVPYF